MYNFSPALKLIKLQIIVLHPSQLSDIFFLQGLLKHRSLQALYVDARSQPKKGRRQNVL